MSKKVTIVGYKKEETIFLDEMTERERSIYDAGAKSPNGWIVIYFTIMGACIGGMITLIFNK